VKCKENSSCINNPGSYSCECDFGFERNLGGNCVDINECVENDVCHKFAECKNEIGGFKCECRSGYLGDGQKCGLYDVCKAGMHNCHEYAHCDSKTIGKYDCTCFGGFLGDGTNCIDIDECKQGVHSCEEDEECRNIDGGYRRARKSNKN